MSQKNPASDSTAQPATTTTTAQTATSTEPAEPGSPPLQDETRRRTQFMNHVRGDPDLTPEEREVSIRKTDIDDGWKFYAEDPKFIRGAFLNQQITIATLTVKHDGGPAEQIDFEPTLSPDDLSGDIVGVAGVIPTEELVIGGSNNPNGMTGPFVPQHF